MAAKPIFLALLFFAFCSANDLQAQCYASFRQDGIEMYNQRRWAKARNLFVEAAKCKTDKPLQNDIADWVGRCDFQIRKEKRKEEERIRRELEEADHAYWESLKNGDISDCDQYLQRYPEGLHVEDAKKRKSKLINKINARAAPFQDCSDCPLMMPVEGGTYMMGSPEGQIPKGKDECLHEETVASFAIGVYEVTVEEYLRFVDATESHYPEWLEKGNPRNVITGADPYYREKGYSRTAQKMPICGISWDDAVAYCKWLSQQTGKKYRLPFEKEWEYAARGGKKSKKFLYAGNDSPNLVAWHSLNADEIPHAVGRKAANELGLYDMSGNLWEWCINKYGGYPNCSVETCKGKDCVVVRGGSWSSKEYYCRSTARNQSPTTSEYRLNYYGFRCVRENK